MKNIQKLNKAKKIKRQRKTRMKIQATSNRLRLSVFRSHKHIYAQIIDDQRGLTLVSASDKELPKKLKKIAQAEAVGKLIAQKCQEKKIESVVFDKGPYRFHGRVAKLAQGANDGGLKF